MKQIDSPKVGQSVKWKMSSGRLGIIKAVPEHDPKEQFKKVGSNLASLFSVSCEVNNTKWVQEYFLWRWYSGEMVCADEPDEWKDELVIEV